MLAVWRGRAAGALLVASTILYLPGIVLVLAGYGPPLAWPVTACVLGAYVVIAFGAFQRPADYGARVWAMLVAAYVVASLGTIALPGAPFPRALLVVLPVMTMVLLGARAGRGATMLSAALLLSAPVLHNLPGLVGWLTTSPAPTPVPPGLIWTQGAGLTALLVGPMILLDRFHQFLMQSLVGLAQEAANRAAAHQNLAREMLERRRLEQEVARVGDEERRRLGHDIHDGVCQQLTGALLRCEALEKRLGRGEPLAVRDLTALSSVLEETIDEAHSVARGLCPLEPEPGALASALRKLTKRIEGATGVPCRFTAAGDVGVNDPLAAQHLYRIAQEALSNVTRHAHASLIAVELRGHEDGLVLEVQDDGDGLAAGGSTTGMGLRTMAFRAHLVQGELAVTPAPAGGTRVLCRVPRIGLARLDERPHAIAEGNHEH